MNQNTTLRADLGALATVDTLCGINVCQEVFNRNGTRFANLGALHTTDTRGGAFLSRNGAFFKVVAINGDLGVVGDKRNNRVGTGLCALGTTNTLFAVYLCDAVNYLNGIVVADVHAVAKTKTTVFTL